MDILNALVGSELLGTKRILDLVMFSFLSEDKKEICLHAQCFVRCFDGNRLIMCTENLYTAGKQFKKRWYNKFDWTKPYNTLFDDEINICTDLLNGSAVKSAQIVGQDIIIVFENGVRLEVLVNKTVSNDENTTENWRLFISDDLDSHVIG